MILFLLFRLALKFRFEVLIRMTRHGFTYSTSTWSSMNTFRASLFYSHALVRILSSYIKTDRHEEDNTKVFSGFRSNNTALCLDPNFSKGRGRRAEARAGRDDGSNGATRTEAAYQ